MRFACTVCHFPLRLSLRWQIQTDLYNRTHKTHTKTLEQGSESSWRWSPAKPAGRLTIHIHHIHTLIGTDRKYTHPHSHMHIVGFKKNKTWTKQKILLDSDSMLRVGMGWLNGVPMLNTNYCFYWFKVPLMGCGFSGCMKHRVMPLPLIHLLWTICELTDRKLMYFIKKIMK